MTNSIGKGTCNFPVNLTVEERSILGQAAFRQNVSMAEFFRTHLLDGVRLKFPDVAEQIERVRAERRKAVLNVTMALVGTVLVLFADFGHKDIRRGRCQRTGRIEVVEEVKEA